GREWNYSVATDVLGRVVEVVSGPPLDEFFADEVFKPLGMIDTAFSLDEDAARRLARLYVPSPGTRRARALDTALGDGGVRAIHRPSCLSGAGGSSTAPGTTTGSPRCCSMVASRRGCACSGAGRCAS
ncbi:MAG TPA: serine hydrolase domain-containing protein, partial [Acidimicrobiales bacterium]|nr:serine hydrolase domain-containing protein [Acidimicrobiales bacterium]